jgi:hypothetical protein
VNPAVSQAPFAFVRAGKATRYFPSSRNVRAASLKDLRGSGGRRVSVVVGGSSAIAPSAQNGEQNEAAPRRIASVSARMGRCRRA